MEWEADSVPELEEEYKAKLFELQRDYELRKALLIAATAKVSFGYQFCV